MGGDPDRQDDEQQPGDAGADEDQAREIAADAQHDQRGRGDRDDRDEVDDALDDDRPEGRCPADPLAVTQVVASDELPEARRKDVVHQVSDEQVSEHVEVAHGPDRMDEPLPAMTSWMT